jgi:uncharacterized protein YwgA
MKAYDFVHLALLAINEEIQGKTKLQKTIYFLGILTGSLNDLGYRPHYYGPYSAAVADAVNSLKAVGFISQSSLGFGTVNDDGFEIARHDFNLTAEGRSIAEKKAAENPKVWEQIQKAVTSFKKAGDLDYMKMSVAAKTIFMLREKKAAATPVELSESAKALGWNPTAAEISESTKFLESLGLVSLAKA